MSKLLLALLFFNLLSCKSNLKDLNLNELNKLFNSLEEHHFANGNISISKNGKIVYNKTVGFAISNAHIETPTSSQTKYRIGSVSKMFTATIIFQLIEEKKLSLTDSLIKFLPDIPNAKQITIEALLRHRSGLANYTENAEYDKWKYKVKTKEELKNILASADPVFTPGSKTEYSNTNFLLLSYIIEDICKKEYEGVLVERILSKINLNDTYFENAADSVLKKSKSYKYSNSKWVLQPETVASNHKGAGAIVSTSADLVTFIDALFSNRLLSKESLENMTKILDGYGMGIFPFYYINSEVTYGHEGRIDEYYTTLIHFPKENISIAYCTNGILYPRDDIMKKVTAICFNKPTTIPDLKSFQTEAQSFKKYAGDYSSSFIPISVECRIQNNNLILTTQGQDFDTKQIDTNYFANFEFGYFFEFVPDKGELIVKETDNSYLLRKNK